MGIIIDVILVAIFALSVFFGYKQGLVKVCISLCAFVISMVLALILYAPVSNMIINKTQIDENIRNAIIENLHLDEDTNVEINMGPLEEYIEKYVITDVVENTNSTVETYAGIIATRVINIIAIVGIFAVSRIALIALTFASDFITNLPIVKQFNEVGGTIYGVLRGFAIIFVALAIVFFIVNVTGNVTISNAIDSTYITKVLYANNFILKLIF